MPAAAKAAAKRYGARIISAISIALALSSVTPAAAQQQAAFIEQRRALAEAGDADAQYRMGQEAGTGHSEDAIYWFRLAAEQGHAPAQRRLGEFYFCAERARDLDLATWWFTLAAEQGDADAQLFLGFIYRQGLGVNLSPAIAQSWLERAAAQGNAKARLLASYPVDVNINFKLCR